MDSFIEKFKILNQNVIMLAVAHALVIALFAFVIGHPLLTDIYSGLFYDTPIADSLFYNSIFSVCLTTFSYLWGASLVTSISLLVKKTCFLSLPPKVRLNLLYSFGVNISFLIILLMLLFY